jgi:cysteine desulfurase/selenocysteine lyase
MGRGMDPKKLKKDFPIFARKMNGNELVYLDNAATSQKPKQVIDAIVDYYENHNANVHRGIHTLSEEATQMYEDARKKIARFIGAKYPEEITFTKGTTESLNRINYEWGVENLKKGDVILVTEAEHHSNLIPWQVLAQITGAKLDFIEVDESGEISLEDFEGKLNNNVKLVAVFHASNVLGTILPVKRICEMVKKAGALVSFDGAQAVPHMKVDVQSIGCDFYSFSGHKMLGPMGTGVLWVRRELAEKMEPYEYGGGMIDTVKFDSATWADLPEKFEAGTPNVAGAVGLAAAVDYLEEVGMDEIRSHEIELNKYALEKLQKIKGIKIFGPLDPEKRAGLVAFDIEGVHGHDIAAILNSEGIAVRSGHHCAMPFHKKMGVSATTRASYYLYNTKEDLDKLIEGIKKARKILG